MKPVNHVVLTIAANAESTGAATLTVTPDTDPSDTGRVLVAGRGLLPDLGEKRKIGGGDHVYR